VQNESIINMQIIYNNSLNPPASHVLPHTLRTYGVLCVDKTKRISKRKHADGIVDSLKR